MDLAPVVASLLGMGPVGLALVACIYLYIQNQKLHESQVAIIRETSPLTHKLLDGLASLEKITEKLNK